MSIKLLHIDETNVKIDTNRSILQDLSDQFSFTVPNHRFHPKVRAGLWNGNISLVNRKTSTIAKGLLPDVLEWAEDAGYSCEVDSRIYESLPDYSLTEQQALEFYSRIKGPFQPRKPQLDAFIHCVNNGRSIILAPTNNGKSYVIHGLATFYHKMGLRTLIVIDRAQLVLQLKKNLCEEFGGNNLYRLTTVYDGQTDVGNVFITTWQSIYENPTKWFKQFDVLIADEVHKFKAASLRAIVDNCGHIKYRHGLTATLDNDSKSDRLTLIGMFGTPHRVSTTAADIEAGTSAKPTIYAILLKYTADDRKWIRQTYGTRSGSGAYKLEFQQEVDFLESLERRNQLIASIVANAEGTTLVAFKRHDHGKALQAAIQSRYQKNELTAKKPVIFIDGTVDKHKRVKYSEQIDAISGSTAVVSVGTFGTGISIDNINNIVIACQIKSEINVPQLIGRGLRVSDKKSTVDIYDVGDDLSHGNNKNATFKHFIARLNMYAKEGFDIRLIEKNVSIQRS